jgi:hypothetical protein
VVAAKEYEGKSSAEFGKVLRVDEWGRACVATGNELSRLAPSAGAVIFT